MPIGRSISHFNTREVLGHIRLTSTLVPHRLLPMSHFFRQIWVRNVLAALAVAAAGFVLLNLAFILNALFFSLIGFIVPERTENMPRWLPPLRHLLFLVVIALVSWPILASRLKPLFKAMYLIVPAAVLFVTIGILLTRWPVLVYAIGGVLTVAALYYFYRRHLPWLYSYAVLLVAIALGILMLLGVEI
jgi:hypothetical protein